MLAVFASMLGLHGVGDEDPDHVGIPSHHHLLAQMLGRNAVEDAFDLDVPMRLAPVELISPCFSDR